MSKLAENIAKKLEAAFTKHGEATRFAREAGVDPKSVSRWARGEAPNLAQIEKIAAYLKTTPAELISDESAPSGFDGIARGLEIARAALAEMQRLPIRISGLPEGIDQDWLEDLFRAIRGQKDMKDRIAAVAGIAPKSAGEKKTKSRA